MSSEQEAPARSYWPTVAVLTFVATLGYLDRALLSYLVEPIRHDLGISDLQLSFLLGFAFILLYGVMTIPMGYLADRFSRRSIIAAGAFGWSAMTIVSSTSRSFWQLFAGRVGLGMGEAVLPPAGLSLIRDVVPPAARSRAISLYNLVALNVGTGLAGLCAGGLMVAAQRGYFADIPFLNTLRPWQAALFWPGAIGLFASLLVLTIREPARPVRVGPASGAGFADAIRHVRANAALYATVLGAVAFANMATTGWSAWLPAAIGRRWGLTPPEIGPMLGTMQLILGSIGAISIGWIMDHFKGRRVDGALRVAAVASLIHLVPAMFTLLAPNLAMLWTGAALKVLINGGVTIVSLVVVAEITPARLIGKVSAVFYLMVNLLGNALGPTVFALVARLFFTGKEAMGQAMLVAYPVTIGASVILLLVCARLLTTWHKAQSANGLQEP